MSTSERDISYSKIETPQDKIKPGFDLLEEVKRRSETKDYRSSKTIHQRLVSELKSDLEEIIYKNLEKGFPIEYRVAKDYEWVLNNLNENGSIDKTDENRYRFWCLYFTHRIKRRITNNEYVAIQKRKPIY